MPVHWYYDVGSLKREFGEITDFQAPRTKHPSEGPPGAATPPPLAQPRPPANPLQR